MLETNIQLFADGGETGAETGENAAAFDVDAEIRKRFPNVRGLAAPQKQAEAKDGKTEPDAEKDEPDDAGQAAAAENAQEEPKTPEQEDAALAELMKGPMKAAAQRYFQNQLNDRFKNHNAKLAEAEKKIEAYQKAIRAYVWLNDIDVNDTEAIEKAMLEDNSIFRAKAIKNGRTVEEERESYLEDVKTDEQKKLAEGLQKAQKDAQEQQRRQEIFKGWETEEQEIRKQDPSFDLAQEIANNPEFGKALDAGMSVTFAYRATHYDANMAKIAGAVEKQTALNTAKQIAAGQKRPVEGGLNQTPAVRTKNSYADLSDEEFLKLFRSMGY